MDSLIQYLVNSGKNLPGLQMLIFYGAATVGVFTVVAALSNQFQRGKRGEPILASTVAALFVGSFLLSLPAIVDVFGFTLFGDKADPKMFQDSFSTTYNNEKDAWRLGIQVVVGGINVVGWFAVARGLWRWKVGPVHNQPGWFSSGLVFVIAGAICVNFHVFMDMLATSIGATTMIGTEYFNFPTGAS